MFISPSFNDERNEISVRLVVVYGYFFRIFWISNGTRNLSMFTMIFFSRVCTEKLYQKDCSDLYHNRSLFPVTNRISGYISKSGTFKDVIVSSFPKIS